MVRSSASVENFFEAYRKDTITVARLENLWEPVLIPGGHLLTTVFQISGIRWMNAAGVRRCDAGPIIHAPEPHRGT